MPSTRTQPVLDRIHAGRLRVRSRLSLWVEQIGLDGLALLMLVIAVLAVNLVLFWLRANEALSWFRLGPLGARAFFEAFPYLWLMSGMLAFVAIASVIHRLNVRARPVPMWIPPTLVVLGIGLGSAAAFSNVNERLIEAGPPPALHPLSRVYSFTAHSSHSGMVGQVVGISASTIELEVRGQRMVVERAAPTAQEAASVQTIVPGDRLLIVSRAANQQPVKAIRIQKLRRLPVPQVNLRLIVPHGSPNERTPSRAV